MFFCFLQPTVLDPSVDKEKLKHLHLDQLTQLQKTLSTFIQQKKEQEEV
jgi:hypothetical protein